VVPNEVYITKFPTTKEDGLPTIGCYNDKAMKKFQQQQQNNKNIHGNFPFPCAHVAQI